MTWAEQLQPVTIPSSPTDDKPIPNIPHCVSAPARVMGIPGRRCKSLAASLVNSPPTLPAGTRGGRNDLGMPMLSISEKGLSKVDMSKRPVAAERVCSSIMTPVSLCISHAGRVRIDESWAYRSGLWFLSHAKRDAANIINGKWPVVRFVSKPNLSCRIKPSNAARTSMFGLKSRS